MNKYPIVVFYSEEDEGYIADIPDLKYCSAFGHTPEEAIREVQIAQRAWLASAEAHGKPIPEPAPNSAQMNLTSNLHVNIHIVPNRGEWVAEQQTQKILGVYKTQDEAIEAARKVTQTGEVVVHDRSGRIRQRIKVSPGELS